MIRFSAQRNRPGVTSIQERDRWRGRVVVLALATSVSCGNESSASDASEAVPSETESPAPRRNVVDTSDAGEPSLDPATSRPETPSVRYRDAGAPSPVEPNPEPEPTSEPESAPEPAPTPEPEAPPRDYPMGDPGCGLDAAAFCATFDAPADKDLAEGRAGELDATVWSGARMEPSLNWGDEALAVGPATVAGCRSDVPDRVHPNQDVLVCDGTDAIQSNYLLVAAAAQNYGQTSLRIRQPLDFADREATIVFDAEALPGGLLGWVSVAITEDPSPAPSFAIMGNYENGAVPRSGIEVHLNQNCQTENRVGVSHVNVFENWVERYYEPPGQSCVSTSPGQLNHFEIRISRTRFEIWGSDASANGDEFGALLELYALDVDLSFERGYVHLNTHNHASLKYSDEMTDAWIARFDDVGFDGPVINGFREYSAPDRLVPLADSEELNLGYSVAPELPQDARTLTFAGVDPTGAHSARLAFNTRYLVGQGVPYEDYVLRYRVNGGGWHEHLLEPGQLDLLEGPYVYNAAGENVRELGEGIAGAMAQWIAIDPAELVSGDNTVEFETEGVPTSYRPFVANVDLVLGVE